MLMWGRERVLWCWSVGRACDELTGNKRRTPLRWSLTSSTRENSDVPSCDQYRDGDHSALTRLFPHSKGVTPVSSLIQVFVKIL